ncbi:ATP-binding cassette sub-family F member 1-like [Camellia sinensis]|uniref:ATP-binding cassette sub-family F member 1-like n=1 Tax=Camellia sinensis TaxID=4442 RepID=UPI0010366FE4|nr:ATP-binding cassette sub-family F member 1-like [Camellia sinensis]
MAKAEKSTFAAEKRFTEAEPSESTKSKKSRSDSATTSGSRKSDDPWAPSITIEDKLVKAGDSASDIEVGNPACHFFAMQAEEIKKELVHKTKEATGLLKSLNKAEAKMKSLIDQAKVAKQAQDEAEEKAGAVKAIVAVLKAEKQEAEDSPLKDVGQLVLPFPPTSSQSEAKAGEKGEEKEKEGGEAEDEKAKMADAEDPTGAKSSTLNE